MIQRRFLSFVFILLFAFAQQQALVHPYVHLANQQESSSPQNNSTSNKQSPSHSEICEKCIALAGIGSAVSSHAPVIHLLSATFELTIQIVQSYSSSTYLPYHSRAPPTLA
jgi:hypothetical protein